VVALVVVTLMAIVLFGVGLMISRVQKWQDANSRVDCSHCGHRVRAEAYRCPACKSALVPAKNLGVPNSTLARIGQLKDAIFNKPALAAPSGSTTA